MKLLKKLRNMTYSNLVKSVYPELLTYKNKDSILKQLVKIKLLY